MTPDIDKASTELHLIRRWEYAVLWIEAVLAAAAGMMIVRRLGTLLTAESGVLNDTFWTILGAALMTLMFLPALNVFLRKSGRGGISFSRWAVGAIAGIVTAYIVELLA